MLAELVFVTRLLGLMSGERAVEARVDPAVAAVELQLDGKVAEVLRGAPWRTKLDFGPELAPHELTAIARDAEGRELARDTQFVNVPRPQAEIGVMFERDRANVSWQHIGGMVPKTMLVKLGSKTLASTLTRSVKLPQVAPDALNVLSIDLGFPDGSTAHRDVVFGGFSEEVPAELTATIVREREKGEKDRAGCFRAAGKAVAASEVETGDIALTVVRNGASPGDQFLRRNLNRAKTAETNYTMKRASLRFIWPVAAGAGNSDLFMTSDAFNANQGLRFLLLSAEGPKGLAARFADAVAVAGTEALREPRRRAVILMLNGEEDQSRYKPETVRRYLQRIGVPLHVWSLLGPLRASAWGEVENISTNEQLLQAVRRLQRELDQQRVAWLPVDPYEALHVEARAECAWEPVAR
ncbi:MAG TPA: hypothetical protein VND45_05825 [Thermoanaerobaculia bacterium]|jgi:hypothetical protein|nr:hypothetical protein [Thermoanaerobaculia bacterium]